MAENLHPESAFRSLDSGETKDQTPVGKLPVVALILGLCSLVVLVAPGLILLSAAAVVVGLLAMLVQIFRFEGVSSLGAKFVQVGVGLGVLTSVWSIFAVRGTDDYHYQNAGTYAEEFLHVLAEGRVYDAMELTKMEQDRQITGTDLEKYYGSLREEAADRAKAFLSSPLTKRVVEGGSESQWKFVRGVNTFREHDRFTIVIEVANQASKTSAAPLFVKMNRVMGIYGSGKSSTTALWNINELMSTPEQ